MTELAREEATKWLAHRDAEGFADTSHDGHVEQYEDLFLNGSRGYRDFTDAELVQELKEAISDMDDEEPELKDQLEAWVKALEVIS